MAVIPAQTHDKTMKTFVFQTTSKDNFTFHFSHSRIQIAIMSVSIQSDYSKFSADICC